MNLLNKIQNILQVRILKNILDHVAVMRNALYLLYILHNHRITIPEHHTRVPILIFAIIVHKWKPFPVPIRVHTQRPPLPPPSPLHIHSLSLQHSHPFPPHLPPSLYNRIHPLKPHQMCRKTSHLKSVIRLIYIVLSNRSEIKWSVFFRFFHSSFHSSIFFYFSVNSFFRFRVQNSIQFHFFFFTFFFLFFLFFFGETSIAEKNQYSFCFHVQTDSDSKWNITPFVNCDC